LIAIKNLIELHILVNSCYLVGASSLECCAHRKVMTSPVAVCFVFNHALTDITKSLNEVALTILDCVVSISGNTS